MMRFAIAVAAALSLLSAAAAIGLLLGGGLR